MKQETSSVKPNPEIASQAQSNKKQAEIKAPTTNLKVN